MQRCLKFFIFRRSLFNLRILCHSVCHDKERIVGGSIPIHRDHVEGIYHILLHSFHQKFFGDHRIRRHEGKHGTHIGMDHAGALTHAANGHLYASHLKFDSYLFAAGIGCHYRFRSLRTCRKRCFLQLCQFRNTIFNPVDRKLHTDHTGRCHQHGFFRYPKCLRCCLRCLVTVGVPFFSSTGIGNSRIDDHCLTKRGLLHYLFIPKHRCRLHHVAGKGTCQHAGLPAINNSHILPVLILDACLCTCCLKAFRCGHAACYHFHLILFSVRYAPALLYLNQKSIVLFYKSGTPGHY